MADNEKLLWRPRPNDNSPKTILSYDLEAAHWLSGIKNSSPTPTPSFSEVSGFIGLLLSFTFNLIHLIVLIIIDGVKWIRKIMPKKKDPLEGVPHFDNRPLLSDEECLALIKKARESGVISEIDLS